MLSSCLQAILHRQIKQRALQAWQTAYAAQVVKHFQQARARGLHRVHIALRVLSFWQQYVQQQQRKADMAATAVHFQRYGSSGAAMLAVLALDCMHTQHYVIPYWQHHVQQQQRKADMAAAAVMFQRYASLGAAMPTVLALQ